MRRFIILWIAFLTALSLAPWAVKIHLRTSGTYHNFGHIVLFFITALLFCWSVTGLGARLFRCFSALSLAMVLEALEVIVFHNPYEWKDVRVDAIGIMAGLALLVAFSLLGYAGVTKRAA